jgi:mannose PTS system EIIC component
MNFARILPAACWAGLIALDFTGFGPWMISQPMVCGPIFGALMGQLAVGLIIGGIVQLLWLDVTPVGVGIPFDGTAVTILATYWATLPSQSALPQTIILALFIAVPFGFVFQMMDLYARRLNSWILHRVESVSDDRLPAALTAGTLAALLWSWLRYALLYFLVMGSGQKLWHWVASSPKLAQIDQGLTMALILLPVAGLGVALELC